MIATRKILSRCNAGDETLLPIFVFLAALLSAIAVIAAGISEMVATNVPTSYYEDHAGYEWLGDDMQVEFMTPASGYQMTAANWTTNPRDDDASQKLEFGYDDWDFVAVRMVKNYEYTYGISWPLGYHKKLNFNEGDDFVALHFKKSGSWIERDVWRYIPFDNLFQYWLADNVTYGTCSAYGSNISVFITTDIIVYNQTVGDPKSDHINSFWFGDYNITLGVLYQDDVLTTKASMWTILGQVLTMQLPEIHPLVSAFIAIPIWAAIGFFIFTVLSRVVPFISGG